MLGALILVLAQERVRPLVDEYPSQLILSIWDATARTIPLTNRQ